MFHLAVSCKFSLLFVVLVAALHLVSILFLLLPDPAIIIVYSRAEQVPPSLPPFPLLPSFRASSTAGEERRRKGGKKETSAGRNEQEGGKKGGTEGGKGGGREGPSAYLQ